LKQEKSKRKIGFSVGKLISLSFLKKQNKDSSSHQEGQRAKELRKFQRKLKQETNDSYLERGEKPPSREQRRHPRQHR
jgi:hypothetical protein